MKRPFVIAGAAAMAVIGFLLFRPDKLFVDDAVSESLREAFATTTTADAPTTTPPSTTVTTAQEPEPEVTTTTVAAGPVALGTGAFYGIDHRASGTATIYQQDGDYVLRFEDDTDIQNGPDLYVWLLPADSYESGTPPEYIDLGKLKGNIGGQNYEVPDEFDPSVHRFVLIWCLRFAVPFAAAPLG